jgi:hypothetical protein
MTETPTSAARAAAEWWAKQLADPTFRTTTPEEDLADEPGSVLSAVYGRALARTAADRHPVTADQLAVFADALQRIIVRDTSDDGWHYGLHTDYHPGCDLAEAAEAAGISKSRFPLKTHMWLHPDGSVAARLGYGGRERLVWAPPGWGRPACGRMRRERRPGGLLYDFQYFPELCGRPRYHEDDCGGWVPDPVACVECGESLAVHYDAPDSGERFRHSFRDDAPTIVCGGQADD